MGPDPRNFNQRVSLGRNDLLIRTFLCISGYIVEHNEMGEVIHNSEKLAEDLLPVTCPTCRVIWYHTHEFTLDDFDSLSGKGDFVVTDLKELNI
ncbi:hypothetical protein [Klebsiella pneumoniae]|uniref:hypothetical protein n=1 Tax=Klebsiella pneumoniae TaxID=573 RepID=UPI003C747EDE